MSENPPVSFAALAKQGGSPQSGGPPYQLRGSDLDKNFVFATLQVHPSLFVTTTGLGGHTARKLKIPAVPSGTEASQLTAQGGALSWTPAIPTPPASGTHVLGAVDGALTWISTEEC